MSNDKGARVAAKRERLEAGDVLDLLVCLVRLGACTQEETRRLTMSWDDHPNAFCRPSDYTEFNVTFDIRDTSPLLTQCVE